MNQSQFWIDHFSPADPQLQAIFLKLEPTDCAPILKNLGLSPAQAIHHESAENKVFGFDNVVIKFFRPGRWDFEALQDEWQFLEDLKQAKVPFVRALSDIGNLKGIFYLVYEAIKKPFTIDREVLDQASVRQLAHLLARVHDIGAKREAKARPQFNPMAMGHGCFEVILKAGYLPKTLQSRYESLIHQFTKKISTIGNVPSQRIHGDSYSGNVIWKSNAPLFIDLDDFQVGPTALDIKLLSFPWRLETLPESMDRRERRAIQHQLVLDFYREVRPFPQAWEALFPLLSLYRDIQFDAWFSARWSEPGFAQNYPDDDINSAVWWENSLEGLESSLNESHSL